MDWAECNQAAKDWIDGKPSKKVRLLRRLKTARDLGRVLYCMSQRPEAPLIRYEATIDFIVQAAQGGKGSWMIPRKIAEEWEAAQPDERRRLARHIRTARMAARVLNYINSGVLRVEFARMAA